MYDVCSLKVFELLIWMHHFIYCACMVQGALIHFLPLCQMVNTACAENFVIY